MALRLSPAVVLFLALTSSSSLAQSAGEPPRPIRRPTRYELTVNVDFAGQQLSASSRITLVSPTGRPVLRAAFILYRLLTVRSAGTRAGSRVAYTA